MDLSLSKFRICALPQTPGLNVSWHPSLPIIRLLGVDMTVDHLTRFLRFWTSRYLLANKLELVKKLEAALLESHRFMKLLCTINHRWRTGNHPSETTGGRILYRRRLDEARDQGQKLWCYLLHFLQHSQRLALEQSGNKETEGWIDTVERELEGEIFFNIFFDEYLFSPPTEGCDIEGLLLSFDCWNDSCKTWIDAADALSRKTLCEPAVGYFNLCPRPQGQQTIPVTPTIWPQNPSGLSQVDVSEQTAGDFCPVSPLASLRLPSRLSPQSSLVILPMRQIARPIQNSYDFNQAAPTGQAIHVVPLLRLVSNSRLASARKATRIQRLKRIPPRSGYFTPRPGRLGRLIQPISPQSRRMIQKTCINQNSSDINRVARSRQAPSIVVPSSHPAPSPYFSSAAAGARGEAAPPRPAPSLHPTPSPYSPSTAVGASGATATPRPTLSLRPTLSPYSAAGWTSGEVAPTRLAPTNVASRLRLAPSPCSPSPADEPRRKDDARGTRSPPRERLNRLMREQFGVDLALPPEERVFPEHTFMTVKGVHTLRPEKSPCLFATTERSSGDITPPRPAPTIIAPSIRPEPIARSPSATGGAYGEVAPPLPPAQSPCSPSPSGRASGEDGALETRSPSRGRVSNNRFISERFGVDLPH